MLAALLPDPVVSREQMLNRCSCEVLDIALHFEPGPLASYPEDLPWLL
jgi:hypothetical protein